MKLIDVDNFLKQYADQVRSYNIDTIDLRLALLKEWVLVELLANTPTVEAIPVEQLLSILPKYDDYIHIKTYPHNETLEDIYAKGHEEGWNACLKAIKEELDYWEKEK